MQMGGRGYGDGIDAAIEQRLDRIVAGDAQGLRHEVALLLIRVADANELYARHIGEHARMVAAHDADADDADTQNSLRVMCRGLPHVGRIPSVSVCWSF